jgi:myo-inositol catabolism protein IolS
MFLKWLAYAFEAKKQGKIKGVGLSNCSSHDVEMALQVAAVFSEHIDANQVMFSLLDYGSAELQKTLALCRKHDITVVAYGILGQGLLVDGLTRERFSRSRAAKMMYGLTFERLAPLREVLAVVAQESDTSMADVAMRWARDKGVLPLVGMRTPQHAREAVAASHGAMLTTKQMSRLDAQALDVSTLDKPAWKRILLICLISLLLLLYRLTRCITFRWLTMSPTMNQNCRIISNCFWVKNEIGCSLGEKSGWTPQIQKKKSGSPGDPC